MNDVNDHVHDWRILGRAESHFHVEPNSRRRHKPILRLSCACGYKGFKYFGSQVIYTWNPKDVEEIA